MNEGEKVRCAKQTRRNLIVAVSVSAVCELGREKQ